VPAARFTLAFTAWLFTWACWSWAAAQLTGGHGVRAATRTIAFEFAHMADAVYLGAERFRPTWPTLRYTWSSSQIENWRYLIGVMGGGEWPHPSGFHVCLDARVTAVRIPWWFAIALPAAAMLLSIAAVRRSRVALTGDAALTAAPQSTLSYALPDLSGRLERRLRFITITCAVICGVVLLGDLLNGPRGRIAPWIDLVQVLAAMAATLGAANLLASPGFRGRRPRVIVLAVACFLSLLVRLLLPQLN
jgi:hypothetical protein